MSMRSARLKMLCLCSGLPRAGMVYRTVLLAADAPNGDLVYRRLFLNLKYQNRKAKQATAAGHLDSGPLTSLSIHCSKRQGASVSRIKLII